MTDVRRRHISLRIRYEPLGIWDALLEHKRGYRSPRQVSHGARPCGSPTFRVPIFSSSLYLPWPSSVCRQKKATFLSSSPHPRPTPRRTRAQNRSYRTAAFGERRGFSCVTQGHGEAAPFSAWVSADPGIGTRDNIGHSHISGYSWGTA